MRRDGPGSFGAGPSMAVAQLQTGFFAAATWRPQRLLDWLEIALEREAEALPLWLPVAMGGGIALWFMLPGPLAWGGAILCAAGLMLMAMLAGAGTRRWARALLIGAGAAALGLALMWWRAERVAAPVLERPVVASFDARVATVEQMPARGQLRMVLRPVGRADLPPQLRVTMPSDHGAATRIEAGGLIRLRARLMPPPRAALPGGYDFARRAWFDRIGAVGSVMGDVTLPAAAAGQAGLRQTLAAHVRVQVPGSAGGIAAALATGDRGGIARADEEAMQRSGLAHLLSISGLHITAAVGLAYWLTLRGLALFPALALRWPLTLIAAGAGAATGLGYTLLSGGEVPAIRSFIAALLVLVALAMGREALTLRLVAAGALAVMLLWPESISGPSFQLSFAAVTSIVALHSHHRVKGWFAQRDEGAVARWARGLGSLLLTGVVVELALMPIALFHFHKAGFYGALANVVAIPLTTFVIMPFEALALALDSVGLGAPAWWVVERGLGGLLWLAHVVAGAPGAVAALPSTPIMAFALAIGGGLWLFLWQRAHRWLGLVALAAGLGWAWSVPAPDILITSDGRHVATRLADGRYALLRDRAGEFVREQLAEAAGSDAAMLAVADLPGSECNRDFCRWRIERDGRHWVVLAALSRDRSDWQALVDACAAADIVIADRWLPRGCVPRWLKVDRGLLAETGGLSINLAAREVTAARDSGRGKPWDAPPTVPGEAVGGR
jgi:competence protein ComEC